MSMLASVPDVRCDDEALRTAMTGSASALLGRRAAWAGLAGASVWGTSVHPAHLMRLRLVGGDAVAWAGSMHDAGYELVTLVRRNPVQQALSAAIAWERGEWHYVDGARPSTDPITLDPLPVLKGVAIAAQAAFEVQAMAADRSHVALVYEDDLRDEAAQQATVDRVLTFLGLATAPVTSPFRRRSVGLLEQIANADEVLDALRQTRFAPFVDELS